MQGLICMGMPSIVTLKMNQPPQNPKLQLALLIQAENFNIAFWTKLLEVHLLLGAEMFNTLQTLKTQDR